MTPIQVQRIQNKIKKIKSAMAAEKKLWGGYHDGRGLRYAPPELYIKIGDYTGGLRYFNWFNKHFPDDMGYPQFLFEWTIILFKTGRIKEAEKKAFETFCRNTYLFDKYFGRPIVPIDKYEFSNLDKPEYTEHFTYSHDQAELKDLTAWLERYTASEEFQEQSASYIEIHVRLLTEEDRETRRSLVQRAEQLSMSSRPASS